MTERICTYVVRDDTGLAPNPFWGWCSLAVCTPNHQGTKPTAGDWIIGCLNKGRNHKLLYAMVVEEAIGFNEYYNDPRFQGKRPNLRGDWKQKCGDNFYSRAADGSWIQHRNRFHLSERNKEQDTRFARAFVGRRFWYRGKLAASVPTRFAPLLGGRGARVNHDTESAQEFIKWIDRSFEPGVAAEPNDNPDLNRDALVASSLCGKPPSKPRGPC